MKKIKRRYLKSMLCKFEQFNSLDPISRKFGGDRGIPIDRYYIEKFLRNYHHLIKGTVLEVGSALYTRKFGGNQVTDSMVLHVEAKSNADILGDLETGKGIREHMADCFILTQTLPCIFNVQSAVKNAIKILKPGGTLLATVPGITQISRFDYDRWGHYWSFTDQSLRRLFELAVSPADITIQTYGNVKMAKAFLYGLAVHEVKSKDLEHTDSDYQMVISAVVKK